MTVPWTVAPTNGEVERKTRFIKDATTTRYHHEGQEQLRRRPELLLDTHNQALRLKTRKDLTPTQFIRKRWVSMPCLFDKGPCRFMAGPNM